MVTLRVSKAGRSRGFLAQHCRMMSARGAGHSGGMMGRSPFWTTPTAACNESECRSARGLRRQEAASFLFYRDVLRLNSYPSIAD